MADTDVQVPHDDTLPRLRRGRRARHGRHAAMAACSLHKRRVFSTAHQTCSRLYGIAGTPVGTCAARKPDRDRGLRRARVRRRDHMRRERIHRGVHVRRCHVSVLLTATPRKLYNE
jgi:hypothetical protein